MPEIWSKAARDAPPNSPPWWSFQEIPSELMPGVVSFALTYHTRPEGEVRQVRTPANTIYAISGVTFVAEDPEARAINWRNFLAPDEQVTQSGISFDVWIGPHHASWMSPEAYEAAYDVSWRPSPHPAGELALLHLLASDFRTARSLLEQAGRRIFPISVTGEEALLIAPDARDGVTFLVRQQPVEVWLRERIA